jgi:hypothetical protein
VHRGPRVMVVGGGKPRRRHWSCFFCLGGGGWA